MCSNTTTRHGSALLGRLTLLATLAVPAISAAQVRTLPPEGEFAPETWVAVRDGVPLRSEPGFVYRAIQHVDAGQELLLDARKGEWLHARVGGWVFADHVRRKESPPKPSGHLLEVTREGARVRSGPGTSYEILRELSKGTELEGMALSDGWWRLADGGYLFANLARERTPATAPAAASTPAIMPSADAGSEQGAGPRRWTLMDLNGVFFEVSEMRQNRGFVPTLRAELDKTGVLESDWTFMRLVIGVPDGPYRFNYSPEENTVVVTDEKGERYGNVYARGPLQALPSHLRAFFQATTVHPGERYEGILMFRPTLRASAISEVRMLVGGRQQRFFLSP